MKKSPITFAESRISADNEIPALEFLAPEYLPSTLQFRLDRFDEFMNDAIRAMWKSVMLPYDFPTEAIEPPWTAVEGRERYHAELTAALQRILRARQSLNVSDYDQEFLSEHNDGCAHDWKEYVGFSARYDFCSKCDQKRNT